MSTATFRTTGRLHSPEGDRPSSTIARWAGIVTALAFVVFLLAWLLGWFRFTTDPRILEIGRAHV